MSDKEPTLRDAWERIKEISSVEYAVSRTGSHFVDNGDGTMTYRRPNPFVVTKEDDK